MQIIVSCSLGEFQFTVYGLGRLQRARGPSRSLHSVFAEMQDPGCSPCGETPKRICRVVPSAPTNVRNCNIRFGSI
jgi:hypothetical protein